MMRCLGLRSLAVLATSRRLLRGDAVGDDAAVESGNNSGVSDARDERRGVSTYKPRGNSAPAHSRAAVLATCRDSSAPRGRNGHGGDAGRRAGNLQ